MLRKAASKDDKPKGQEAALPASLVVRALSPASCALAVVYALLALSHPLGRLVTGAPHAPPLAPLLAAGTSILLALVWLVLRRQTLRPSAAHVVLFGLGTVMVLNASAYMLLVRDPVHTTNFILIGLSAGFLMLSRPWLLSVLGLASVAWTGVAQSGPVNAEWVHWGAMLAISQLLGFTVHEIRLRTTARLISLRALAEERGAEAQAALQAATEESRRRAVAETELRASEKRLAETQRRESLGLMAGGVAHDFNNLLTSILGNADLLASAIRSPESRQALVEIRTSSERAAHLCRQMLAYAGRATIEKRAVDLARVVEESVGLLGAALSKRLRIDVALSRPPPLVEGDPTEIGQVVVNLITNASEAIVDGAGTVEVEVSSVTLVDAELAAMTAREEAQPGRFGMVLVRDRGAGMNEGIRERMFDPFFSTKESGTGLGLAASLGIARALGGAIDVHSKPQAGTEVRLYLPVSAAASAPQPRSEDPDAVDTATKGVLLVDDEASVRTIVTKMLQQAGHRVTSVSGVEEALALSDEILDGLDVALIDLSLPDGSGIEVSDALARRRPGLHRVLMSGFDREDTLRRRSTLGLDYLAKPFRMGELLRAIARAKPRVQREADPSD